MLPSDTPRLPAWPFLLGDAILLGSAALIAYANRGPLTGGPLVAVVVCLVLGVVVVVIPFMVNYARSQDEVLDERQRALEALAEKVANSADQISVACTGLNGLVETTHRNLKYAEQLPHKLQDKIAEFNQQLSQAQESDREEMERELATLRAGEGDRLEAAADKAQKAALELGKVVASADKRLQSAIEALGKADKAGEAGAAKMQQVAAQMGATAAEELIKSVQVAQKEAGESIGLEIARVVEDFEKKVAVASSEWNSHVANTLEKLDRRIEKLETLSKRAGRAAAAGVARHEVEVVQAKPEEPAAETAASQSVAAETSVKEQTTPEPVVVSEPVVAPVPESVSSVEAIKTEPEALPEPAVLPAEIAPTEVISVEPDAPKAEEPIAVAESEKEITAKQEETTAVEPDSESVEAKPARKKTAKQRNDENQPSLGLELEATVSDEFTQESPDESKMATSVSADGATRLLVTAYIGIGNRLYVRGEGPGLNSERGTPLQFVSIGKWRWETAEATNPVRIKLLKNDQQECPMLGEIMLEPGHQAEVTANF